MVASDFAFLVLGLILGITSGAALIVIVSSRPRSGREVRLTVTPDSVPRRRSTTLAGDPFTADADDAARGGPADQAWYGDYRGTPAVDVSPPRGPLASADRPAPVMARTRSSVRNARGVPVDSGLDPMLAELRREAQTSAVGAAPAARAAQLVSFERGMGLPPAQRALVERKARRPAPTMSGIAILETAVRERLGSPRSAASTLEQAAFASRPGPDRPGAAADRRGDEWPVAGRPVADRPVADRPVADRPVADRPVADRPVAEPWGTERSGAFQPVGLAGGSDPEAGGEPAAASFAEAVASGPCAAERRAVVERCALADRMRAGADGAALALRSAQTTYDERRRRGDAAAEIADGRAQRAAKDAAQRSFRKDRARATSRDAVEAAARTWLQEINRINADARDASALADREREAAASLLSTIERLTTEADAARIQAESAQSSCHAAREALVECDEAAVASATAARTAASASDSPEAPPLKRAAVPTPPPPRVAATVPSTAAAEQFAAALLSAPANGAEVVEDALLVSMDGERAAILRLLAGDRATMHRLVGTLAGDDPAEQRRWQLLLSDLVDAIVARAIEACAFEFPDELLFWSGFSRSQDRDIALALFSLGFRFDGLGGFADDRVPTQRDLSLAVGYAGLDPMRVRRWPSETEMADLYREVSVAADEYLVGIAAGLTLGQLVTLLGRRADGLADLWNAWGRVRPLLIEPS